MATHYHAYYTAGALLYEEMTRVISRWQEQAHRMAVDDIPDDWLLLRSGKSRQTKAREVRRRLTALPDFLWKGYADLPYSEQRLLLYYSCMKAYPLLFDFHLEAVMDRWRMVGQKLTRADFDGFLQAQELTYPEISRWTPSTRQKLGQVTMKMLREAGLLSAQGDLQKGIASDAFWRKIAGTGDLWILELMFLNESERRHILNTGHDL